MADREPWERNDNPEPWTRPDKPAPWLNKSKKPNSEPWDQSTDNPEPWTRPASRDPWESSSRSRALSGLRGAENNAISGREGFYTGNGRNSQNSKSKAKSNKRKAAVIGFIAALLLGGGIFLASSNSLLPSALANLLTSATSTQLISNSARAPYILQFTANGTSKSPTWPGNNFSDSFLKRLNQNGITSSQTGNTISLNFNGTTISGNNFREVYRTNPAFRDAYDTARRSKVASYYDKPAYKTYSKNNVDLNMWKNYKQTGDSDTDETEFNTTMTDKFDGNSTTEAKSHSKIEYWVKENRLNEKTGEMEEVWVKREESSNGSNSGKPLSSETFDGAKTKASHTITALAQSVSGILDGGCGIYRVGNLISMMVAANSIYQSIHYFQSFIESPSRMMAGLSSAINATLNKLNYRETANIADGNGGTYQLTGSMLEASGLQLILGGAYGAMEASALSQISKSFSVERTGLGLFNKGYVMTACSANQLAESAASLAVNLAGGIATIMGGFLIRTISSYFVSEATGILLSFMVPTVASLFLNTYTTSVGIAGGHTLASGASAYSRTLAQNANGSSFSSKAATQAFNQVRNEVIALEAEVDRMKLSPFDITNPNTFFGSIAYSLLPMLTSTSFTSLASIARNASTSFATLTRSLTGIAAADGENTSYTTTYGDCPALDSIDAAGDIYCNAITTTDPDTIDISPDDPTYQEVISESTYYDENTGNYEIAMDSELAKYITYIDGRTSPPGIVDASILNDLQPGKEISFLGNVPVVQDIMGVVEAASDLTNMEWATGAVGVNSDENERWDDEIKYYQRYVEDQRLVSQITDSENPVITYLEKYEKEHPLDNSQAGVIARYTGMSKSDAEQVIAFVDYVLFIEEYDSASRIALKGNASPKASEDIIAEWKQGKLYRSPENTIQDPLEARSIAKQYVIYFDVRNRSCTV